MQAGGEVFARGNVAVPCSAGGHYRTDTQRMYNARASERYVRLVAESASLLRGRRREPVFAGSFLGRSFLAGRLKVGCHRFGNRFAAFLGGLQVWLQKVWFKESRIPAPKTD